MGCFSYFILFNFTSFYFIILLEIAAINYMITYRLHQCVFKDYRA
jgi:hypothetical protein